MTEIILAAIDQKRESGCVFTATIVSHNIPEGVLFTDFVKRLENDRCFKSRVKFLNLTHFINVI